MKNILFLFVLLPFYVHAQSWVNVGPSGFSPGPANSTVITIDKHGTPYIAYSDAADGGKANVMKFDGVNWVHVGSPSFSPGGVHDLSIKIDTNDVPYIAYRDFAYGSRATVMRYIGGSWVAVGTPGFSATNTQYLSMTLDNAGIPYVAYEDFSHPIGLGAKATVMKYTGSGWDTVGNTGFSAGIASYTSITVDSLGTPYVVYQDGVSALKTTVMRYDGSSWVNVGMPGFSANGNVTTPRIAIAQGGIAYVVYSDDSGANVMKYNGSGWVCVGTPHFTPDYAMYTSIAFDQAGILHVAYTDGTASGFRASLVKYNGTNWVHVGTPYVSVGEANYTSLAISKAGVPYVAYRDVSASAKATVRTFDTSVANGVNDVREEHQTPIAIFPNPSNTGEFTIFVPCDREAAACIAIKSIGGRKLYEVTIPTNKNCAIATDSLSAGVYFVDILTATMHYTERISVVK